jgi:hypothetical protein
MRLPVPFDLPAGHRRAPSRNEQITIQDIVKADPARLVEIMLGSPEQSRLSFKIRSSKRSISRSSYFVCQHGQATQTAQW